MLDANAEDVAIVMPKSSSQCSSWTDIVLGFHYENGYLYRLNYISENFIRNSTNDRPSENTEAGNLGCIFANFLEKNNKENRRGILHLLQDPSLIFIMTAYLLTC